MWFKNLRFYTVDLSELNGVLKDDALVEEALEKASFKPCAAQELASVGFAPIFSHEGLYHFSSGENHFFKLIEETSRIRGAVIVLKEIEPSVVSAANRSTFQSASVMILPYWDERSNSPLKESGRKISIQVAGFTVSLRP